MNNLAFSLGVGFMLAMTLLFFYIFLVAYSHPQKIHAIAIDGYGEADVEMFLMWPIILAFGFYAFIETMRGKHENEPDGRSCEDRI